MRHPIAFLTALTVLLAVPGAARSEDPTSNRVEYKLEHSKVALGKSALTFKGRWSGAGTKFNPGAVQSEVAVNGPAGSTGPITLVQQRWKTKGRSYHYTDGSGSAGGVRSIVLVFTKHGGSLHIKMRGTSVGLARSASPTTVAVTLTIGTSRWCAEIDGPFHRSAKTMTASSDHAPASCPCTSQATSTWAAIQTNIIARYGCAAASCHSGPAAQNGLDLSPDVAYANLVGVASRVNPDLQRVARYDKSHSAFWLKLAMKTDPTDWANAVGGTPMPSNAFTLTAEELEAVRLWIQNGAPEDGVVNGTDRLLAACLPPPDPIKIVPPAPPAVEDGIQLYAPPWVIKPAVNGLNGEGEICQATYYDFSATIPDNVRVSKDDPLCAAMWGGNRDCFYAKRTELTQTPNSHHSIIHIYRGAYDYGTPEYTTGVQGILNSTGFGPFTCRDGANKGVTCDPGDTSDRCPGSVCAGRVQSTVACVGYGPKDYGFDVTGTGSDNSPSVGGSQQPYSVQLAPPSVFFLYPVKGTVVWNSHAFNVTDQPTTNEQYLNLYFDQDPADRVNIFRAIFDARYIFTENVPTFAKRQYCATFTLPQGARLSGLSSHTHKRGVLFQIWMPPNAPCTPCQSGGTGINGGACVTPNPACGPGDGAPIAVTTTYNDPVQYHFGTPMPLDSTSAADRTLKYCAVYDNGLTDSSAVKRQSTSPATPFGNVAPGGPCKDADLTCFGGPKQGQACHGDDSVCDGGVCDACPLRGGVTTEDEMFILLGDWYCPGTLEKSPTFCPG